MSEPTPFSPSFARADVDRMLAKVRDARLPPGPVLPGKSWAYGTDHSWLSELHAEWKDRWSYEAFEGLLQR
jgi:hypothetical protein